MLIIFIFLLKCLFKQHDVCVQLMTYKISVLLINKDTFEKHFSSFFSTDSKDDVICIIPMYVKLYIFVLVLPAGFRLNATFENYPSTNSTLRCGF